MFINLDHISWLSSPKSSLDWKLAPLQPLSSLFFTGKFINQYVCSRYWTCSLQRVTVQLVSSIPQKRLEIRFTSNLSLGILGNAFSYSRSNTVNLAESNPAASQSPAPRCARQINISPLITFSRISQNICSNAEECSASRPATRQHCLYFWMLCLFSVVFPLNLNPPNTGASQGKSSAATGGCGISAAADTDVYPINQTQI